MAKNTEKKPLEKKNWISTFNLIGRVIVTTNTFSLDAHSQSSDWIYNRMSLIVDCGKYGKIDCQMMGGYGYGRNNVIYVHGKNENGVDDFSNFYTIDWDDRKDIHILSDLGDRCFKVIGLQRDSFGKTYYKKILTEYDAVNEIADNLKDGDIVNIKGNLKYQIYNDSIIVSKDVTSIVYSNIVNENDFKASFRQTVLLDRDCIAENNKDKKTLTINGYVLEKFKSYNGFDLTEGGTFKSGKFIPLLRTFEYEYGDQIPEKAKKAISYLFKISKNVTQITFDGVFKEGGATVEATLDDLTDDIRELIDLGIYTEEEALATCATNGSWERKMILEKPYIRVSTDNNGNRNAVVQIFKDMYTENDIDISEYMTSNNIEDDELGINLPEDDEDIDWMNELGI